MNHPVQTAAKMLGIKQRDLFALLRRLRMVNDQKEPMRLYVDQGMLAIRDSSWVHPVTQQTRYYRRTLITDRGVAWLSRYLQEHNHDSNHPAGGRANHAATSHTRRPADRRNAEPR